MVFAFEKKKVYLTKGRTNKKEGMK